MSDQVIVNLFFKKPFYIVIYSYYLYCSVQELLRLATIGSVNTPIAESRFAVTQSLVEMLTAHGSTLFNYINKGMHIF